MGEDNWEFPKYSSHKVVEAALIKNIGEFNAHTNCHNMAVDIAGETKVIAVPVEYVKKHTPEAGGYFVRYEDGYESFSPAAAFEGGYTLIK